MLRLLLALAMLACSASSLAQDAPGKGRSNRGANADDAVQRAIAQVTRQYSGRVLSATPLPGSNGQTRVRVKFLSSDGVIKVIIVDPN